MPKPTNATRLIGSLLGTAAADSIALPYEGLSKKRVLRLCGDLREHRFFFSRGMVSDDTEHTVMVAQSLIASMGDVGVFKRDLARRMRMWLLRLPAGAGLATLRSIARLWLGFGPDRSGVFSAGNGPAMRSAIIGVFFSTGDKDKNRVDYTKLREFTLASAKITHTDPRAGFGALAVAVAAAEAPTERDGAISRNRNGDGNEYLERLTPLVMGEGDNEGAALFMEAISDAVESASSGVSTEEYAAALSPGGVSGFVMHTVPVAIHAWTSHRGDFAAAVRSVTRCGGDTDTVAAIVGGIMGGASGKEGIPTEWLEGLIEWPATVRWMEELASTLAEAKGSGKKAAPPELDPFSLFFRNIFFLFVVLLHGLRRLLPPYS